MQRISSIFSFKLSGFKKGIAAVITVILAAAGIYVHSRVVMRRDVSNNKSSFFKDRTYDVLFFGSSHVKDGISPLQLYKNYGITAYNLATDAQKPPVSYYVLKEAVRFHKPKLAVLDVYNCRLNYPDEPEEDEKSHFHRIFDNFPFSLNKTEAAKELSVDSAWWQGLLFPYSVYHSRWAETDIPFRLLWNENSFWEKNMANGFTPLFRLQRDVSDYEAMRRVNKNEYLTEENTDGIAYVKRFVSFCLENGMQPVLVYLPPACGVLQQKAANSMQRIAAGMRVPYYNFLPNEAEIIDCYIDFYDCLVGKENIEHDIRLNGNIHLNLSGAQKMTSCLGAILRRDFALQDHRGKRGYEAWDKDYQTYRSYILGEIGKLGNLDQILMACSFEGLTTTLYASPDTAFDDVQQRLIAQLGNRITVIRDYDGYARIVVTDDESGSIVADVSF